MTDLSEFFEHDPYALPGDEKQALLLARLNALDVHHARECKPYRDILKAYGKEPGLAGSLETLPFLPVRLFKEFNLKSIPDDKVFKVLTSSGTTGQTPSRITLDSETARLQTRVLVKIMQSFLGKQRMPMIVIDHPGVIRNPASFSARGAGIMGMMNFGRTPIYALMDDAMAVDIEGLVAFSQKHQGEGFFLFGFTFMVWKYFIQALERAGVKLDLSKGVLVHSGGWKKLQDEAVDNATFKQRLRNVTGIERVHNFYGMVEQVGSVFVECEHGHLHAPGFADVIVRDPKDWSSLPIGEKGILQVVSVIPESYPGHSLLTEDFGTIIGTDDCPCGRKGKYFSVHGRVPQAEVRGCSDTHTQAAA
jgi:phenylacetate-coenzyme A ligase PaaK-like adenylate-forming protein